MMNYFFEHGLPLVDLLKTKDIALSIMVFELILRDSNVAFQAGFKIHPYFICIVLVLCLNLDRKNLTLLPENMAIEIFLKIIERLKNFMSSKGN